MQCGGTPPTVECDVGRVAETDDVGSAEEEDILDSFADEVEGPIESPSSAESSVRGASCGFRVTADLSYAADLEWKHKLDVYQPVETSQQDVLRPVYFHIHGGGWKRGDRQMRFYGAPSVCEKMSGHHGYVAVAPSYRLGHFPTCMHDVVAALHWTIEHAAEYGGDANRVVLSGHSAGGHLASLLFLQGSRYGLTNADYERLQAIVLISGVYSLQAPLLHRCALRNAIFRRSYVKNCFGEDAQQLDAASPSTVLLALGARAEPVKSGCCISNLFVPKSHEPPFPTASGSWPATSIAVAPHECVRRTPFLVLNASVDLGLEVDGQMFAKLLIAYVDASGPISHMEGKDLVQYVVIEQTNHASICWRSRTTNAIAAFLTSHALCEK